MSAGVPILAYHAIDSAPSPTFTPPEVFESQLKALADNGWQSVTFGALLAAWRDGKSLPEKAVVITFDDGYASVYESAWARLRDYGFSATVFLITDFVGRDNQWRGQGKDVPARPLLTWEQIGTLAAQGCEFSAHTRTHPPLTTQSRHKIEAQMQDSADAITQRLGQPTRTFCYPYGAVNTMVRDIAAGIFDGAVTTRLGTAGERDDLLLLPRIDAYYLTPEVISRLDSVPTRAYLNARNLLRRVKRLWQPDWSPEAVRE